jgi:hypothetical protein
MMCEVSRNSSSEHPENLGILGDTESPLRLIPVKVAPFCPTPTIFGSSQDGGLKSAFQKPD